MKQFFMSAFAVSLIVISFAADAQEYVHGYTRSNGTYVEGYTRSSPDSTVTNNYSYQGNTNPSTGQVGTNAYVHDQTSPNYVGPDSQGNIGHAGSGMNANPYGTQTVNPYGR